MDPIDRIKAILSDEHAPTLVEAYFDEEDEVPAFTGAHFETIGENDPDRFTADDMIAVSCLAVEVPARQAIWMLGPGAGRLTDLLARIPTDGDPKSDKGRVQLLEQESELHQLWYDFTARPGIGWVTAGKLCARKRPALAPIYDTVVRDALNVPEGEWWSTVVRAFDDVDIVAALTRLRDGSCPSHVTLLRTLDIAVWMRQHGFRWSGPPDGGPLAPLVFPT